MTEGAWYRYPEPGGRAYSLAELRDPRVVQELFDYCQLCLAVIHDVGWRELFDVHGVDGLLGINRRSGWFDETNDEEAMAELIYHARIAGYDPESKAFGSYDAETGELEARGR